VAVLHGRQARTNQRIWTDVKGDGNWLVSGGTDGVVKGWNLNGSTGVIQPTFEFEAHEGSSFYLAPV
jgi:WD40 repeat protein